MWDPFERAKRGYLLEGNRKTVVHEQTCPNFEMVDQTISKKSSDPRERNQSRVPPTSWPKNGQPNGGISILDYRTSMLDVSSSIPLILKHQ